VGVRVHVSDRERQERTGATAQQELDDNNNKKTKATQGCADYWGQDKDKNRQNGSARGERAARDRPTDRRPACVRAAAIRQS
jgi:hypothetical protein